MQKLTDHFRAETNMSILESIEIFNEIFKTKK